MVELLVGEHIIEPEGWHTLIPLGKGIEALCLGSSQTSHYMCLHLHVTIVLSWVLWLDIESHQACSQLIWHKISRVVDHVLQLVGSTVTPSGWQFLSLRTLNVIPQPLASIVSAEKSVLNLTEMPLWQSFFSCFQDFSLVFDCHHFLPWYVYLWISMYLSYLEFIEFPGCVGYCFSINLESFFFLLLSLLSSPSNTSIVCIQTCLMVSPISLRLHSFFFILFALYSSAGIFSIYLSSGSLIFLL